MGALRVVSDYVCRSLSYQAGSTIEVSEEEKKFLLADAPGCFIDLNKGAEDLPPEFKLDGPPEDTMVHESKSGLEKMKEKLRFK